LDRIGDIVYELEKQITPLKKQKEKAETYLELKEKLTSIEVNVLVHEISEKITPLVEEIRHCDNIQSRIDKIKIYELHQKLKEERQKTEQQEKVKSKNKYRGR